MAVLAGQVQCGKPTKSGRGFAVGSRIEQDLHHGSVALHARPMEGGHAVALCTIHIRAIAKEGPNGFGVIPLRGVRDG